MTKRIAFPRILGKVDTLSEFFQRLLTSNVNQQVFGNFPDFLETFTGKIYSVKFVLFRNVRNFSMNGKRF